ncbi:ImpA family metalloprotease [Marinobacter hydrocarbonoclasticus]|nr:ImpA family metalloprotease [Marinobacter nauticus]
MVADCLIEVQFEPIQYQVLAQSEGQGELRPQSLSLHLGQRGQFEVEPADGHALQSIEGCAGELDGDDYLTGPVAGDCTVTARFVHQSQIAARHMATASSSPGGTVSPQSLTIDAGQTGTFDLAAAPGFRLASVSGCEGTLDNRSYTTGAMTADCLIDVQFAPTQYQALARSEGQGALSPQSLVLHSDQRGKFEVQAAEGHTLHAIEGCGGKLYGVAYITDPATEDCTVTARFISRAQNAINHQDHRLASEDELIDYARQVIAESERERKALVDRLFQGIDELTWNPKHDSIVFESYLPETAWTLLPSNVDGSGNPAARGLVMVAQQPQQRLAAMGANLFTVSRSSESEQLLRQLIDWLTQGADQRDGFSVVTAQVPSRADSWYFPHNEGIRSWLNSHYPDTHRINDANACDYDALSACIDIHQPDLIVLSDIDRQGRGHSAIKAALERARQEGIPLLLSNYKREASAMLKPLYQQAGLYSYGNYWKKLKVDALSVETIRAEDQRLATVDRLMLSLQQGDFSTASLDGCTGNFLNCGDARFVTDFKSGADWLRKGVVTLDSQALDGFSLPRGELLKASLLLADKYRSAIDYPIGWQAHQAWQQAMYADWVVNYARSTNPAQPDLGEYVIDRSQVLKGSVAHYAYPETTSVRQRVTVPYRGQWTTTGWYALPGQAITLQRHDNSSTLVKVKLNYHRPNTNRAYSEKVYRGPLELATQRLSLAPGGSLTFSSPYGGPIYLHLDGAEELETDITATGIAQHPAILDFSDADQIAAFNQRIENTELPHVDLRTPAAEQHLRRDRFLNGIRGAITDVTGLLGSVVNDHINPVYSLAGYKIPGQTLAESLPEEVRSACSALLGQDCLNDQLHVRTIIQHANYDQNAHCGGGCAGNPWDAAWDISPTGWGDNHELGHNLQTSRLNVHYAAADDVDHWPGYYNRAGENSNNLFPYYIKWRTHYLRDGNSSVIIDTHMNHKALFFGFMSDAAGTVDSEGNRVVLGNNCRVMDSGSNRYEAAWASNDYAIHNGYRMAFYIQMALRAHRMALADGTVLSNGFNLFTLLYQYNRVFGLYAGSASNWEANRARLGFDRFAYSGDPVYGGRTVKSIPGNDFMLVALSHLTGLDWRSHFDLLGLRYSSLASAQAQANALRGSLPMGMYVLETDLPPANLSEGLTFLPLSLSNGDTLWPRDGSSPVDCVLP